MYWRILIDHIHQPDEPSQAGRGNHAAGDLLAMCPYEFQILDGDDVLYYSGICGDLDEADQLDAFEPLDWAADFAGATTFMYRKRGATEWQML